MLRLETLRIRRVARLPCNNDDDCRLHHIGVYIILNCSSAEPYLNLSIIEQFLVPELDDLPKYVCLSYFLCH